MVVCILELPNDAWRTSKKVDPLLYQAVEKLKILEKVS
jgi:hypothetical protein